MAHANSYCRGQVEDPLVETARLLSTLVKNPNIVSESYLSVMNGTSAAIDPETDKAKSAVTRTWIEKRGYTCDKSGVGKAIKDGWCCIYGRVGSEMGANRGRTQQHWKYLRKGDNEIIRRKSSNLRIIELMLVKSFFTSFLFTFSSFLFTGCLRIFISNRKCYDIFFKRADMNPELRICISMTIYSCHKSSKFRPKIIFCCFQLFNISFLE
jgi:hypothetical protein